MINTGLTISEREIHSFVAMNLTFVKKVCRKTIIASGKYLSEKHRREMLHEGNIEARAQRVLEMSSRIMVDQIDAQIPIKEVESNHRLTRLTIPGGELLLVPLDGKESYVFGQTNYSIGIAYQHSGVTQVAGVFNPQYKELFFGESDKPLKRNNQFAQVNDVRALEDSFLGYSYRGDYKAQGQKHLNTLFRLMRQPIRAMIPGSDLFGLTLVANGNLSGMILAAPSYDSLLPGLFIVERAGGRVTDVYGDPVSPTSELILASNKHIHTELIENVRQSMILAHQEQ